MEFEISEERNYTVNKANDIVQRARYDLTISELKAFAFVLSKVKITDEPGQEYVLSAQDFCKVAGIDYKSGGNYSHIKTILKKLRDKSFWLMDETGRESTVGWLSKVRVNKGSGKITVKLDEDIQDYVIKIHGNFTQYSLLSTLPMKSSYSFRIYELLISYMFRGAEQEYDIDDLKARLAAPYVNFKDFRRKVIEVAVAEINQWTDIEVSWQPITGKGRKVEKVLFTVNRKDNDETRDTWIRAEAYLDGDQIPGQMTVYDFFKDKEK